MKIRSLVYLLAVLLLSLLLVACGNENGEGGSNGEVAAENSFLRLLRFVPDTPEYREWLTFGDNAAWHDSWDVPRINDPDELDTLARDPHAYWLFIMPAQTTPPGSFGLEYLRVDDMNSLYGFSVFTADRFLEVGPPPENISIIEFGFDSAQISETLTSGGYESAALDGGGTLFSILDDYRMDLLMETVPSQAGVTGALNRIAVLDSHLIVARATALVTRALDAEHGDVPSLADDPAYIAAATALEDESLSDTGELVGIIILPGSDHENMPSLQMLLGERATEEQLVELREGMATELVPLPDYTLVAFATRHSPIAGASFLTLAVVFPKGADAAAAADILVDRLSNYVSLTTRTTLEDWWTLDRASGVKANGLPVALVTMRADDPPIAPEGEGANADVWRWSYMIQHYDVRFLITDLE